MNNLEYPSLYQVADATSIKAQAGFLLLVKSYLVSLILGSLLSVAGIESSDLAALAAFVFIVSIILSIVMFTRRSEDQWYRARAIAESVKTSTWRFMMKGAPYLDAPSLEQVKKEFRNLLRSILVEHKDLAHEFGGLMSQSDQITQKMCEVRQMELRDRIDFYSQWRIDEQRKWYAKKSSDNKKDTNLWFFCMIAFQTIAVFLVIFRVAYPQFEMWPTEVFVVTAGAVLTWMQVKRFRELASSYGLAAQEIGIIRGELDEVKTESEFIEFVKDSENAFSREHTQWIARKNNPAG